MVFFILPRALRKSRVVFVCDLDFYWSWMARWNYLIFTTQRWLHTLVCLTWCGIYDPKLIYCDPAHIRHSSRMSCQLSMHLQIICRRSIICGLLRPIKPGSEIHSKPLVSHASNFLLLWRSFRFADITICHVIWTHVEWLLLRQSKSVCVYACA